MNRNRLALVLAGFTAAVVLTGDSRPTRLACAAVLTACLFIATRKRRTAPQQ